VYIIYTMADKKISQFDTFPGAADDEVFFVVASGDADNPNASNYRYPFTNLTTDITNVGSAWATGTDLIYTLTGAVGLGTTAPIHQLDVATTGRFRSDLIVSGDLYVSGTTHINKIIDASITGTISGVTGEFADGIFADSLTISGVSVITGGSIEVPGGGGSVIGGDVSNINFGGTEASDTRAVNFQVGGVDKLVIGSDGDVGIAEDLTVSGLLRANDFGFRGDDIGYYYFDDFGGSNYIGKGLTNPYISLYHNAKQTMVWKDGKVGIGTDDPQTKLHVSGLASCTGLIVARPELIATYASLANPSTVTIDRRDQNPTDSALTVSRHDTSYGTRPDAPIFNILNGHASSTEIFRIQGDGAVSGETLNFSTGAFSHALTISGNSVLTGAAGGGGGGKWSDGVSAGDIYYNGGKVGIGTNDPLTALHLKSDDNNTSVTSSNIRGITLQDTSLVDGALSQINFATSSNNHATQIGSRSTTNVPGTPVKGEIYFVTRDIDEGFTQKMVIKPDGGFVGIGTANPTSLLTLSGDNADLRIVADVGGTSVTVVGLLEDASNNGGIDVNNSVGNNKVRLRSTGVSVEAVSGKFTESLTISGNSVLTGAAGGGGGGKWSDGVSAGDIYYNGGNVGIGVTSPGYALSIHKPSPYIELKDTDVGASVFLKNQNGNVYLQADTTNTVDDSFMAFTVDNATGMVISGGKVGIGYTDPQAKLDVRAATNTNGIIVREAITNDITHNLYLDGPGNGTVAYYAASEIKKVEIKTVGDSYFNGGNVGIGTTTPGAKLSVLGLAEHVDNAAALAAGLVDGDLYRTADYLKITHYIIISSQLLMVSAGTNHSLFLTTAGDVYACGNNTSGRLGDGTTDNKLFPTRITGDVTEISAGTSHSMFLSTSSESYACGYNRYGRLGDGTTDNKLFPTRITGDVTEISAGNRHSMFLSTSSESYACGLNDYGQLGDGTTDNKYFPTHITGDVTGISAGGWHSMFLSTSSESYACGSNSAGRLGDGTTDNKLFPTHITGDVTGISAGNYHSMFLSIGSESYACGRNYYGPLGDGSTVNKDVPTYITGDVAGISAGEYRSMFLSTSSEAYACGFNSAGQLGDGTTVDKHVPTYISGQGA
jgi:alpha-tubulin suppressor-like RCC1 family protein